MEPSDQIENICKKLKPLIGDEADKLWYMYLAEDEIGRKDIALDIEILSEKLLKKTPLEKEKILLEPPAQKNSQGSFLLGDLVYNDSQQHKLYLKPEDFTRQIGIFAMTGEGKTNLAFLLASQLAKAHVPFLIIDWKRSWRNLLSLKDQIPELKKVKVFTVGRDTLPFLWNPFRPPPSADKELWIGAITEALEKSHLSGPGVAYHINTIFLKFAKALSGNFYPNFFDGLKKLENIKASMRELMWKQTAQRIFQSFTMGSAKKAFNTRDPIKLESLLNDPVILELDLELPKPLRIFLSEIILRWIHLYRLSQGETENLRHVLFLEEAHNLFAESGFHKETNSLENIYREIRSFGQGIVSITQHPSMLPIYILGNCHTQIYLGLQHAEDIQAARKALFLDYKEESYPSLLNIGECILKIKNRIDPCQIKVPLMPIKKGVITDAWLRENTPGFLHGFHDAEKTHTPWYLPPHNNKDEKSKKPSFPKSPQQQLLIDIHENPFSGISKRYKRLGINPKYGNKFKNQLIAQGCIQPRKIITNKGSITLFDLTKKGRIILRDLGFEGKVWNEGIVHKFWKHKIARNYEKQGHKVEVETYFVNGRPDIIVTDKTTGKKTAVEIETGKSNAIKNIQRALDAGFDEVICLGTNKLVMNKIKEALRQTEKINAIVKILSVLDISFD